MNDYNFTSPDGFSSILTSENKLEYKFENNKVFVKDYYDGFVQIFFCKKVNESMNNFVEVSEKDFKDILIKKKHPHGFCRGIYFYDVPGFAYTFRHCAICGEILDFI